MAKLNIEIVTPEKIVLEKEADEIIIPTITGEITVLPHHVPLLVQLAPGEVILKDGNLKESIVIVGGFLEISNQKVSILADYAVHGKDISAVKAQEAKDRAEKAMKEKVSEKDYAIAEAELQRAMLELKVIDKVKRRTHTTLPIS